MLTRWYICQPARASVVYNGSPERGSEPFFGPNYNVALPAVAGFVSRVLKFIPLRPAGQWTGRFEVPGTGLELTAVTYDPRVVPVDQIQADFDRLEAASDYEVFDIREQLLRGARDWSRFPIAKKIMDSALIDTALMAADSWNILQVLRQLAMNMAVHQNLSRFFTPLPLGIRFDVLPERTRDATADFLVETGMPVNRLPTDSMLIRDVYRRVMLEPPTTWGLERISEGDFHLGTPEANLKSG